MATEEARFRSLRDGVFAFMALTPRGGFRWRSDLYPVPEAGVEAPPPYLVPVDAPGPITLNGRSFLPRARADGLHRTFARLSTEEEMVRFASRYGRLGGQVDLILGDPARNGAAVLGEPLAWWQREIAALWRLLDIKAALERRDRWRLGELVEWRRSPLRVVVWPEGKPKDGALHRSPSEVLAAEYSDPDGLLARWARDDPVAPAWYYIHLMVNRRLRGHVSPAVLPYMPEGQRIVHVPDSLLAALWVLLALDLAGGVPERVCAHCGKPFTPTRRDEKYCNSRCRKLAWYHRNKEGGRGGR